MPSVFIKWYPLRLHMADVSEYAPLESRAFQNLHCPEWEMIDGCVITAIKKGQSIDELTTGRSSLSDKLRNTTKMWEKQCKACGLAVPYDILETNNPEFDGNRNVTNMNMTLSKTGAQRRRDEAIEVMVGVADAFNFDSKMIAEANKLLTIFHNAGGSSGGRGFKTSTVAALRVASVNAGRPIAVSRFCSAHPEKPVERVVNRLIKDVRRNGFIPNVNEYSINDRLVKIASTVGADAQLIEFAKKYTAISAPLPLDVQAAAALYLAAGLDGRRPSKYSAAAIARKTFINRKRINRAARLLQQLGGLDVKENPPKEKNTQMPASLIQELRRVRKG